MSLFQVTIFLVIRWITKTNVILKNIKKIEPPDSTSFLFKVGTFISLLLLGAMLSWINILFLLGQMVIGLLTVFRDLFSPLPEEIKLLRFPLRNNPNLSREAVWAYVWALRIKNGEEWNSELIHYSLDNLVTHYPSVNSTKALKMLEDLKVVNLRHDI